MFNLPNLLTVGNLLCGCVAVHAVYTENFTHVLIFFVAALVFDLLDGLAARALRLSSELGAQLDSLADMISFGFLPGVIFFHLITDAASHTPKTYFPAILGFVFTAAAALRLAKFNIDDRQTKDFMGLNTPAATIAVVGLYVIHQLEACATMAATLTSSIWMTLTSVVLLSMLLLVDLPMLSFKFDLKDKKRLVEQSFLIAGGIIILFILQSCALPFLILWYVIFSIIRLTIEKTRS